MSPRISYAVARPFVKRIADYAYSFMRVLRRLNVESLNGKKTGEKKMQPSIDLQMEYYSDIFACNRIKYNRYKNEKDYLHKIVSTEKTIFC